MRAQIMASEPSPLLFGSVNDERRDMKTSDDIDARAYIFRAPHLLLPNFSACHHTPTNITVALPSAKDDVIMRPFTTVSSR